MVGRHHAHAHDRQLGRQSPDLADVGLAAAAGFMTGIVVACKPAGAFPIRDAAAQFLPSVCNTTVGGDFGNRRPPPIQTAVASGADTDGAREGRHDHGDVGGGGRPRGVFGGRGARRGKLAALFTLRSADKTDLDLASVAPSGAWGSATQSCLRWAPICDAARPRHRRRDARADRDRCQGRERRALGGRHALSTAADNTVEITGCTATWRPALVSVVADDADDGDAILGAGDTLTSRLTSPPTAAPPRRRGPPSLTKVDGH